MKNSEIIKLLPTDEDVAKWYDENIDEKVATVSSSIYKFRLFLKEHIKAKIEPIKHNIGGFMYSEEITKVS